MTALALGLAICLGINIVASVFLVAVKRLLRFLTLANYGESERHEQVLTLIACGMFGGIGLAAVSFFYTDAMDVGFEKRLVIGCIAYWFLVAFLLLFSILQTVIGRTLSFSTGITKSNVGTHKNISNRMEIARHPPARSRATMTEPKNRSPNFPSENVRQQRDTQ